MGASLPGRHARLRTNRRGSRAYGSRVGPGLRWSSFRDGAPGGTRGSILRCPPCTDLAARSRQFAPRLFGTRKRRRFARWMFVRHLRPETAQPGMEFHAPNCWLNVRALNGNAIVFCIRPREISVVIPRWHAKVHRMGSPGVARSACGTASCGQQLRARRTPGGSARPRQG
jgi:hypothetical protein